MRSIVLAAVLALMGSAAHAVPTAVDFATISMTTAGEPRTVSDTVCVSDGRDLACDRGVYITSDSRVGIATSTPQEKIDISGNLLLRGVSNSTLFYNLNSSIYGGSGIGISTNRNVGGPDTGNERYWVFTDAGDFYGLSGHIGVGIYRTASSSIHTAGSIRVGSEASATMAVCDTNRTGAIRYTGGDFSFCRNGSAWETLTGLSGGGGLGDRIVSGTSAVVMNSATGIVSITQLGAVASYVHPSLGYIGPGVSTTGRVSSTGSYLAATDNQCLTLADEGLMFRNATTRKLQVCVIRY